MFRPPHVLVILSVVLFPQHLTQSLDVTALEGGVPARVPTEGTAITTVYGSGQLPTTICLNDAASVWSRHVDH